MSSSGASRHKRSMPELAELDADYCRDVCHEVLLDPFTLSDAMRDAPRTSAVASAASSASVASTAASCWGSSGSSTVRSRSAPMSASPMPYAESTPAYGCMNTCACGIMPEGGESAITVLVTTWTPRAWLEST